MRVIDEMDKMDELMREYWTLKNRPKDGSSTISAGTITKIWTP
jgi:hypothetical protein